MHFWAIFTFFSLLVICAKHPPCAPADPLSLPFPPAMFPQGTDCLSELKPQSWLVIGFAPWEPPAEEGRTSIYCPGLSLLSSGLSLLSPGSPVASHSHQSTSSWGCDGEKPPLQTQSLPGPSPASSPLHLRKLKRDFPEAASPQGFTNPPGFP